LENKNESVLIGFWKKNELGLIGIWKTQMS